ncbi:MAG: hypothetical protein HN764_15380 [Gammaproteobacteria bacterium]|jgi:hypothetical protein|nr:hypothetical protein [Gammaproteobacteria bacterium]
MESLTLEQVYYVGELVGVVIVVVSLIYVGRQLSQNNRSQRIAAIQSHNDTYRQNLSLLADHSEAWIAGLTDFSNLDAPKQIEFAMVIQCIFRHIEQSYFMVTEGVLKECTYLATVSNSNNIMAYPGAKDWWLSRRSYFNEEFVLSLESHMNEQDAKDIYLIREKE